MCVSAICNAIYKKRKFEAYTKTLTMINTGIVESDLDQTLVSMFYKMFPQVLWQCKVKMGRYKHVIV